MAKTNKEIVGCLEDQAVIAAWDKGFGSHYENITLYATLQKYDEWDSIANTILSHMNANS